MSINNVLFRIAVIIALVEFLIMIALGMTPLDQRVYLFATLDFVLLVLISTPLIYWLVVEPFVSSRDEALRKIEELASTDFLTGLPNRRFLMGSLKKLISTTSRHGLTSAALMVDLDGFKSINDSNGHDAGDKVLSEIASRFREHIRDEDSIGRLGGDEFMLLIGHLDADEKVARKAALETSLKLVALAEKPIYFAGNSLQVGASIGVRMFGSDSIDVEMVLRDADDAMYQAKRSGKGRTVIFNPKKSDCRH